MYNVLDSSEFFSIIYQVFKKFILSYTIFIIIYYIMKLMNGSGLYQIKKVYKLLNLINLILEVKLFQWYTIKKLVSCHKKFPLDEDRQNSMHNCI